jgi:hypothetical protein
VFTLQLNKLTKKHKAILPPTDSRLRPDQRALERGDFKTGSSEKHRIEEKQRKARKEREADGIEWKPVYFEEKVDEITKENSFVFTGQYWKDREEQNWSKLSDIF